VIVRLIGRFELLDETHGLIDLNGVGHKVGMTSRDMVKYDSEAIRAGQAPLVTLHIHTVISENKMELYGFADPKEMQVFRLMMEQVQGVGAVTALSIVSALPPERLADAIHDRNTAAFRDIKGVGPKIATRIVQELQNNQAMAAFRTADLFLEPAQ
jgi:holliday junction DNA helicase RuvA